jgi:hypothetical protein
MVRLELLQRLDRLVTELSVRTETGQLVTGGLQGFLHLPTAGPFAFLASSVLPDATSRNAGSTKARAFCCAVGDAQVVVACRAKGM